MAAYVSSLLRTVTSAGWPLPPSAEVAVLPYKPCAEILRSIDHQIV